MSALFHQADRGLQFFGNPFPRRQLRPKKLPLKFCSKSMRVSDSRGTYALDNFCHPYHPVASGLGIPCGRRFDSSAPGNCPGRGCDQSRHRPQNGLTTAFHAASCRPFNLTTGNRSSRCIGSRSFSLLTRKLSERRRLKTLRRFAPGIDCKGHPEYQASSLIEEKRKRSLTW